MKKGTFLSYQLAEAVLLLNEHLKYNNSLDGFDVELNKLKQKWKDDIIPSSGTKIPDLFSMQSLTIEQLLKLSNELKEYDTYTTENSASMQNITKINSDGTFNFDFSALDSIVKLARQNVKKIVIDSAIVHGDHFPEQFSKLSKKQIRECINSYITELISRYGDVIERIDVLNAIFERKDVKSITGTSVEDFWIEKFGENYGEEIINICKEALREKDIPLCWNEFYVTNVNCSERKNRFLSTVSKIKNLDVIGIQDAFQDTADLDYTTSVLKELEDICSITGKKYSITELSCILSKKTVMGLYDKIGTNPSETSEIVKEVEERINGIIERIVNYSSNSEYCASIEGRISKELDYYSHRPELREFNERTGILINTVGNNWNKIVGQHKSHKEQLEEMFNDIKTNTETNEKQKSNPF